MNRSGLFFAALVGWPRFGRPEPRAIDRLYAGRSRRVRPAAPCPAPISATACKLAVEEINAKGGILGKKIDMPVLDTQSEAGVSRGLIQKVLDNKPYVVFGPVYSGSVLVDMQLTQKAEIPEIVGGEAATITQKGNPYVFRTSFGQQFSMPNIANYIADGLKAKTVALVWVNSDFGKPRAR